MNTSLRLRLAGGVTLVMVAALGTLGFAVMTSTRSDLESAIERQLEQSLDNRLRSGPPPPGAPGPASDPRNRATAHIAISPTGTVIVEEPAGPPSDPLPLPDLDDDDIAALRDGSRLIVGSVDSEMRQMVLGATADNGVLEIEAAPLGDLDDTVSTLRSRLLVGSIATLLMAVAAVLALLTHGLRPLRSVVRTAEAVASGERTARIPTDEGPSEIRHLSSALDRMLEQQRSTMGVLEASEARLRRFVADASHELQTPITSVMGWTDLLQRGAVTGDDAARALERVSGEARRMADLVDDLLLLARLDEHRPVEMTSVDIAAVVRDCVADANAIDPHRVVDLGVHTDATVWGDADRLHQVVANLLANVRVHTPVGTHVAVSVSAEGDRVVLRVDDDGPGIDAADVDAVFDRFWRGDPSRTRSTGGSGLGLSVVAAIVQAHGGTISAANRADRGASFTVVLPTVDPRAHRSQNLDYVSDGLSETISGAAE